MTMNKIGKYSDVWNYFEDCLDELVACALCKRKFTRRSTAKLKRHLQKNHPQVILRSRSAAYRANLKNLDTDTSHTVNGKDYCASNSADELESEVVSDHEDGPNAAVKEEIDNVELISRDEKALERKRQCLMIDSPTVAQMHNGRKYSDIWNYCKDYKDGKATCLACNRQISCKSTSNFKDHLERRHPHIKLKPKKGPYKLVQVDMKSFDVTDSHMDNSNGDHSTAEFISYSDEERVFKNMKDSNFVKCEFDAKETKTNNVPSDNIFESATSNKGISECDAYGTSLAIQLHQLDDDQRFIAEKLISDIIYYGRFSKLTDETHIELCGQVPQRIFQLNEEDDISKQLCWKFNGDTIFIANENVTGETEVSRVNDEYALEK